MSGKEMRLLHLTDLHMRHALAGTADRLKRLSRDIPANLDRVAKRLEDWSPDVIVMTGSSMYRTVVDGSLLETDPAGYQQSVESRPPTIGGCASGWKRRGLTGWSFQETMTPCCIS